MANNTSTVNPLAEFSSLTCEMIDEILKKVNATDYESINMTREAFINARRPLGCIPTPYHGVLGVKKWVTALILLAFLIFGLIGNLLSATIMFRRSRRGLSSYFYLGALAIVDICVLYSGGLLSLLEIAFLYQPKLHSSIHCRLAVYIQHFFTYTSAWLIVAVTFERFLVVRFPIHSIRICRLRVAYTTSLILVVFFAVYTSHCFFTMDLFRENLQTNDGYHPNFSVCDLVQYRDILSLLDMCLYSVLPSIFIIIFNVLIIVTMLHALRKRRTYLQGNDGLPTTETCARNLTQKTKSSSSMRTQFFRSRSGESSPAGRSFIPQARLHPYALNKATLEQKKSQQMLFDSTSATGIRLTCLLLLISFTFVLCTLLPSIGAFLAESVPEHSSTTHWQLKGLTLTVVMYLNHTINFVLYCLTGRAFRNECRKLLCGLWALKDIHISCTMSSDSDKHHHYHQQILLADRNRMVPSRQQQQQQRMKRSYL